MVGLTLRVVRPPEVTEALQKILLYMEGLEEQVLRGKMPEAELTDRELSNLDKALLEMRKGESISLEEFNKRHGFQVQSHRPS
jgi:hypothetical protein